ncbi:MAG: T9SS type A sorting domain-containing protein [Candidatus Cloacimonetes bacterium]|nr:T9SS type A sorting domain-containing protein [Candidatus Cloacimonadota bacterium]MCF7813058.1 T9SS type A sorting domain-containing protein [Candidatus Cloacimonadota bacterium]MCF7867201.1 T9SS type A sorting domain-containing protein [Candidatus Cloacimonadota bacterium]MCF7882645.1 T9SS type A sorting domain-containing protein [Candidatus Cloacimonadota bacterium]
MRKILIILSCFMFLAGFLWGQTEIDTWQKLSDVRSTLTGDYVLTGNLSKSTSDYYTVLFPGKTYKNTWATGTYYVNDLVLHDGIYYYATVETSNEPPHEDWAEAEGWNPIGGGGTADKFTGTIDGDGSNNYTISDIYINHPDTPNVGLFGHIGRGAVIKNLGLETVDVKGARGTGSLVGRVTGDETTFIEYCYANGGTVVGDGATGGLVGSNNSHSTSPSNRNEHPTIQYSWANIAVSWSQKSGSGADKFGGLAGCNQKGNVFFCYARGTVTVDNDPAVTVSNDDGSVPSRIGGLIGCILIRGLVESCYSTGLVTTNGSVANVGGLVGRGGTGGAGGNAYDSFYQSPVTVDTEDIVNPNLLNAPVGLVAYTPAGVTLKNQTEMQTQSTYTDAGWDFDNIWTISGGYPELSSTMPTIYSVVLTNGNSFNPSVSPGNSDQTIGRFALNLGSTGTSYLERVTVKLNGTRTGASNFKLWESTDENFGSGTQYGLTVSSDPGTGGSVSFAKSGFTINTSTKYYFLTCDVASDATGSIDAELFDSSSLLFYAGELSEDYFGTEADPILQPLSGDDATLPVVLSDFSAEIVNSTPVINWTTQSETENLGWNIYRSESENGWQNNDILQINNDLIAGMGTTTQPTDYQFSDTYSVEENSTYYYWLQSVSYSQELELYGPVSLFYTQNGIPEIPAKSCLYANHPNPFNPQTSISFDIAEGETGSLSIFNMKGQMILQKDYEAGQHSYNWNADNISSGLYLYRLETDEFRSTKKMLLLK